MARENARERILQAAIKVFADKSFEGSRIDEISREANVPKSLIYYHFKSKDEILEVLTLQFIEEYIGLVEVKSETHREKSVELGQRMKTIYYEFGQKNADIVRIIWIDSLKKSTEVPVLYKMLDAFITKEAKNKTKEEYDLQERRIAEFFTNFIPNFAYLCFADSWINYYQVSKKQYDETFLRVYEETHGAYHKYHK